MSRLAPLVVIVLALVGCDPAVQARYQPTSVDEVFGPFSRIGGIDAEVHELPAPPPALDQAEFTPRACRPPGVLQKPLDMVGIHDDRGHGTTVEPTLLASTYEPPLPSPPPGPAYRIAGWNRAEMVGAKESIATPSEPSKLVPGRSVYRNEPVLYGAYRRDVYAWCDDAANLR